MISFEFNTNTVNKVIDELEKALKYIRIAIFQLHHSQVFDTLNEKLKCGVKVEILTLPYDSINNDIQIEVVKRFEILRQNGAILNFCRWNIGDPERTTTVIGRWYSFHGKFIVTDKAAIALSANFTQQSELDALLVFENEPNKILEYNQKFDELLELFINVHSGYDGIIRKKIMDTKVPNALTLFELPRIIETDTHKNHWINDYPSLICPAEIPIEDKLYIAPFDVKGRNLFMNLLTEAKDYAYISTESFTDRDFVDFLMKISLKGLDIRILTGSTSMDYSDRMQIMLRELIANGLSIRTIDEDIHAKLIITEKRLLVSSINLNKMNLGFKKSNQLWRENTESISICSDNTIITSAKSQYLSIFDRSNDISIALTKKLEKYVGNMFSSLFGLRSREEVKILLAKFILFEEINVKQCTFKIGKIISYLMRHFNKTMITKKELSMALILFYLSERKHTVDQINDKLNVLNISLDLTDLVSELSDNNFIEKENDYYKIKVESLF